MRNPWLAIPLSDYEGHMALPGIGQAQMLAQILADVHCKYTPQSLAVLGCAGGNGFDSVSPAITRRVVGVDLNPRYVAEAQARYGGRFQNLELYVADIEKNIPAFTPVNLVFAALILEYVDIDVVIARTRFMLETDGKLATVVQLPSSSSANVTPSPFASLRSLGDFMHLVPPDELRRTAQTNGYTQIESRIIAAEGGKHFQVQVFELTAPS